MNLIKKPWPYNPKILGFHIENPINDPRSLNKLVPTFDWVFDFASWPSPVQSLIIELKG